MANRKMTMGWIVGNRGWQYVVVDLEWFVTNPGPEGNSTKSQVTLDDHGRYVPAINRFPSAVGGARFKPLPDYVHALGLKFGIHILRGIPKEKSKPVESSSYHPAQAADTHDTCPWNPDNFGTDSPKPTAQAYYDSIADWESLAGPGSRMRSCVHC
jgi:alpha-galactosidase